MINNPWHYDRCDKVMLSASMVVCAIKPDAEGDSLILAGDYGIIDIVAEMAAQQLPGYCDVGEDYDCCVWFELLEDRDDDSLAHWLTVLAGDDTLSVEALEVEVGKLLVRWLRTNDFTLRSHVLDHEGELLQWAAANKPLLGKLSPPLKDE